MRLIGVIHQCESCGEEYEIFSDDGGHDTTVCWNWCPKCGKQNNIWIRLKEQNEKNIKRGLTYEESHKKFGESMKNIVTWGERSQTILYKYTLNKSDIEKELRKKGKTTVDVEHYSIKSITFYLKRNQKTKMRKVSSRVNY